VRRVFFEVSVSLRASAQAYGKGKV
jgi:hypothetical protein